MKRMKQTHERNDDNVIVVTLNNTRRTGHKQQRVLFLNPNKKRYDRRKEGKHVAV